MQADPENFWWTVRFYLDANRTVEATQPRYDRLCLSGCIFP